MPVSVIIPFLNEGENLVKTVEFLRSDYKDIEIILINDFSTDGYDYYNKTVEYNVRYISNKERAGVAESRNLGVELASNDIVVLLDGHMRISNGWVNKLVEEISKDGNSIYNASCQPMSSSFEISLASGNITAGAYLRNRGPQYGQVIDSKWVYPNKEMAGMTYEIPVVLGAFYAFTKSFWKKINGLYGLRQYGSDEAFMSLKAWGIGGSCKIISSIIAGHIFKTKFNYDVYMEDQVFNKLLVAKCIYGEESYQHKALEKLDFNGKARDLFNNNKKAEEAISFCKKYVKKEHLERFNKLNNSRFKHAIVFENETLVGSKLGSQINDSDVVVRVCDFKNGNKEDFGDPYYTIRYFQMADSSINMEKFNEYIKIFQTISQSLNMPSKPILCLLKYLCGNKEITGVVKIFGYSGISNVKEKIFLKYLIDHFGLKGYGGK